MIKLLAFAGSTRRDSLNRKLIQAATAIAQEAGAEVTLLDLNEYPMPLYNGDLEAKEGLPESALCLKSVFKAHDTLMIASPEYNSSVPPMLKNTLDWVSRDWHGESGLLPYQNKLAAIMAASPGALGGMRMLPHLRQILNTLGVMVLPGQFALAHADQAFDETGLKSPQRLESLIQELIKTATALTRRPTRVD